MEEVIGSNPIRSTKTFQTLSPPYPAKYLVTGVQLESKPILMHGQSWALCTDLLLPTVRPAFSMGCKEWAAWAPFCHLLFAGDDNNNFPYKDVAQGAHFGRVPRLTEEPTISAVPECGPWTESAMLDVQLVREVDVRLAVEQVPQLHV